MLSRRRLLATGAGMLFAMLLGSSSQASTEVTTSKAKEDGSRQVLTLSTTHIVVRADGWGKLPAGEFAPSVVLYDQTDSPSINGFSSQNFEPAFDAYDDQDADDFVVPAGPSWKVDTVVVPGSYSAAGTPSSIHVTLSRDAVGLPGVVACDYPALAYTDSPPGSFSITLPGGCLLTPGAYWVSVQANMNVGTGGQWFWTSRTVQSNNRAVWRNPGGGFGTTCSTYTPQTVCGAADPDQLFRLLGSATVCQTDADCNNGNLCDGVEACVASACVPGTPTSCNDGRSCTVDTCVPATGQCAHSLSPCDDGDPCTVDSCHEADGCHHLSACFEFCNPAGIAIADYAPASPYPSPIVLSGLDGVFDVARVKLRGLSHMFPDDIDMLLAGPGARNATILSDVGGSADAVNLNLTLQDSAGSPLPDNTALSSGTFRPANMEGVDAFAAPAPVPTGAAALSAFGGIDPNGTWSLFVVDDLTGDSGTLAGGWCLEVVRRTCKLDEDCEDLNPCTVDACNVITLSCEHPISCDDGIACTINSCDPATGACAFPPVVCDDANVCTDDACAPGTGLCMFGNNTNPCDDGNSGTTGDTCQNGVCVGTPTGPPNDACAGAIPLPLNRTIVATTSGANDDYHAPANVACFAGVGQTPTTAPGRDIVFSFQAPTNGAYSVRIIQQGPNSDPTRTQNAVLYASNSCPSSGMVSCIAGANRAQSETLVSINGASSNQSEELVCIPMTAGQTIYVFFDDAAVAGTPANPGGVTSLEAIPCVREAEPNNTVAQANAYQCGILGTGSVGAVAHCYLGTRAGQVCTRSLPLDESFAASNKVCSITGVPCAVNAATGVSTCAGGPTDYCQQRADYDCDPRCDVGPNAGRSCTTNAFCNPVSDQGAVCAGTCQIESVCVDAAGNPGIACTPICVGGLFPGRYCSSLSGCPGGGVCTTNAMCPAGSTCSRQFNEGDVDFFSLGTPVANSKVFATVDAKSANDSDWRMRITSDTKTLQFDDDDGIGRSGANAPVIAGALTDGNPVYVKVSRTAARASEPYELDAIVRGPLATAQLESESGPTGNDIYYGWPGDVVNANYATSGGYVRGTFGATGDSDCFKFIVNEGDLMDWYGDGNPARIAGAVSVVNVPWPVVFDAEPAPISNFVFGLSPGRRNTNANVQVVGLSNLSPAVGPPGHLQWRATYTGMLEVCFYDDSSIIGLGNPSHPSAWAGSLGVNCGPIRPAGPGTTSTDVAVTKAVSAGPYRTGSFVTYTITTTNSASDIAQEIRLSDTLDPNLSFISLTIDDGFGGNNTACFTLPTPGTADSPIDCINTSLAPGASTTYTLTVQIGNCIGAGVHISNTASITTVSTDPDPSNDSATANLDTTEDGTCADLSCNSTSCVKNLCTNNDHCEAGVCVSTPLNCDDNSLCTDDSCDPTSGCVNDSSQVGDQCNDFEPCTLNFCDPILFCVFPPAPATTTCDDGLTCTSADHCDGQGTCLGSSVCDDGNACTADFADEANSCACSHTPALPGTACDDGNPCTGGDACSLAATCVGTPASAPAEPTGVIVGAPSKSDIAWSMTPNATSYDLLRGSLNALPVGPGGVDEVCLGTVVANSFFDNFVPAPGTGVWYLVRAKNTCYPGSDYGTQGVHGVPGATRQSTTCAGSSVCTGQVGIVGYSGIVADQLGSPCPSPTHCNDIPIVDPNETGARNLAIADALAQGNSYCRPLDSCSSPALCSAVNPFDIVIKVKCTNTNPGSDCEVWYAPTYDCGCQ